MGRHFLTLVRGTILIFLCLSFSSLFPISFEKSSSFFSLGCYDLINFHHRKFPGKKICQHQFSLSVPEAVWIPATHLEQSQRRARKVCAVREAVLTRLLTALPFCTVWGRDTDVLPRCPVPADTLLLTLVQGEIELNVFSSEAKKISQELAFRTADL